MTDRDSLLPESTQLGRVRLRVNDFRGVGEFYTDVVGLEVLDRTDQWGRLGVDGTPLLELVRDEAAAPRGQDEAGLFHTAFRVPSRSGLGAALDRIETLWELDGASNHGVSEALYLSDPEGNGVEIYRDRPREEWPICDDGRVQMDTAPLDMDAIREPNDWVDSMPAGADIGHVHLEVTSLPRAREFYVDTLGIRVRQSFDKMGLFLAFDDYHHHLGLNRWHGRSEPSKGRGIDYIEFVVESENELDLVGERLSQADIPVEAPDTDPGIKIQDPDGIDVLIRRGSAGVN